MSLDLICEHHCRKVVSISSLLILEVQNLYLRGSKGLLGSHSMVGMRTNMLHCQQGPYFSNHGLLFSDLLHTSHLQSHNSVLDKGDAVCITFLDPSNRSLHSHSTIGLL